MNLTFSPRAWYEYSGWQLEDKKILKRINLLIKDIERNGNTGIGKPEPLRRRDSPDSREKTIRRPSRKGVRNFVMAALLPFELHHDMANWR